MLLFQTRDNTIVDISNGNIWHFDSFNETAMICLNGKAIAEDDRAKKLWGRLMLIASEQDKSIAALRKVAVGKSHER